MSFTVNDVRDAVKDVQDPDLGRSLLDLNMIDDIVVNGVDVALTVYLTTPACPLKDKIRNDVIEALNKLEEIGNIDLKLDHRTAGNTSGELAPGVRNFIAVASGKGGVGKSTTAVNLALSLVAEGAKVGLLDADLTGPSIPKMLGLEGQHPETDGKSITPIEAHGLKTMSIGYLVGDGEAITWRGPMLHKALAQFIGQVEWGELDYLIIDLPPGTGDVQISLVQLIPLTGVVVVSTPQDLALLDVRKCLGMFRTTNTHVFGLIENMSSFLCGECGTVHHPFGHGGAEREAERLDLPFLGSVPLRLEVREAGDSGQPACLSDGPIRDDYSALAREVARRISIFRISGKSPEKVAVQ